MFRKTIAALLTFCSIMVLAGSVAADPANDYSRAAASDTASKPVQVFDVAAGKVVKSIPNDAKFQKMATSWTESVTGLAPQISGDSGCSFVYRVPLDKPATVTSGDIAVTSNDLFLFYCQDKPPLLLMFDGQRKPYLFLFKADIAPFIKKVGLPGSHR